MDNAQQLILSLLQQSNGGQELSQLAQSGGVLSAPTTSQVNNSNNSNNSQSYIPQQAVSQSYIPQQVASVSVGSTQNNDLQTLLLGILNGTNGAASVPPTPVPAPASLGQLIQQQQGPQSQLLTHHLLTRNPIQVSQPNFQQAQVQYQPSQPQQLVQHLLINQNPIQEVSQPQVIHQQAQVQQQAQIQQASVGGGNYTSGGLGFPVGNPGPALTSAPPNASLQQAQQHQQTPQNNAQLDTSLVLGIVQALSQLQGGGNLLAGPSPPPSQVISTMANNDGSVGVRTGTQVPDPPVSSTTSTRTVALLQEQSTGGVVVPGSATVASRQQEQQNQPPAVPGPSVKQPREKQQRPPPASTPPRPAKRSKYDHTHLVDNSNTRTAILYVPSDDDSISPYAAYARQQIEFFEAQEVDVNTGAQGRNKPVKIGQVGLRCIHCKHLHPKLRTRGAVYYPSRLGVLYQAAQNTVKTHLPSLCESMPDHIRTKLLGLNTKRSSVGGGKHYWSAAAQIQGVIDTEEGLFFKKQDK